MATITQRNAAYRYWTGSGWTELHFKTKASQVNLTESRVFLHPTDNLINGKALGTYADGTWTPIEVVLYGTDIDMADDNAQSITSVISTNSNSIASINSIVGTQKFNNLNTGMDMFTYLNGLITDKTDSDRIDNLEEVVDGLSKDLDFFLSDEGVGTEAIDTLKEIQNFISTHGSDFTKLSSQVNTNTTSISANSNGIASINSIVGTQQFNGLNTGMNMFTYLNGLIVENQSSITSLQEDLETLNDALDDYTIFEYGSTEPTGLTTTSNVIWLATTS